jgi:plastocyanin
MIKQRSFLMKVVIIIIAVIAVLGGGAVILSKNGDNKNGTQAATSSASTNIDTANTQQSTASTGQTAANTITYTGNGFTPSSLTLKAGSQLTVKNNSSSALQFDSDPHPEHTDDPEINIGDISPGASKTITVTKTGTHGYHNHLNAGDTGTLIVQ